MDNTNQMPPQEPINNLSPQPPSPVIEPQPQQTLVSPTLPPAKSKRRIVIICTMILLLAVASAAAWFIFGKKDKQNSTSQPAENSSQTSQVTENSGKCAYVPKQNYQENEGIYSTWRENAKKVNFDVYLPCKFDKNFNLDRLAIGGGDGDERVSVFLGFNRPEPEEGEDGLTDDSSFDISALPPEHNPPSRCLADSIGTTNSEFISEECVKLFDSKYGPVYENSLGDLLITIGNSLVIWSYPPFNDSKEVKPILEIVDSLQKVDPTKLELFCCE